LQASSGLLPDQGSELLRNESKILPAGRIFVACGLNSREVEFAMAKTPKKIEVRKAFFQMFVKNTVDGGAKNRYYGNTK
jgi:hypothetical protein